MLKTEPCCFNNSKAFSICINSKCEYPNPFICNNCQDNKCELLHFNCAKNRWHLLKKILGKSYHQSQLIINIINILSQLLDSLYIFAQNHNNLKQISDLFADIQKGRESNWNGKDVASIINKTILKDNVANKQSPFQSMKNQIIQKLQQIHQIIKVNCHHYNENMNMPIIKKDQKNLFIKQISKQETIKKSIVMKKPIKIKFSTEPQELVDNVKKLSIKQHNKTNVIIQDINKSVKMQDD